MFVFSRYVFSLMLLGCLIRLCDGGPWVIEKKVDLRITNDLGTGSNLNVHCKSKDDDLGVHVLTPDQYFEFRFRPNFLGTTLYFCKFWWGGESHWFNIYVEKRDTSRCDSKCWWMVGPAGPCLLDGKFGIYDLYENWNDQQLVDSSKQGIGKDIARMYNDSKYLEGNEKKGK